MNISTRTNIIQKILRYTKFTLKRILYFGISNAVLLLIRIDDRSRFALDKALTHRRLQLILYYIMVVYLLAIYQQNT